MAVALQVSHDKVYAAYSDCKIRVWRRNWDRGLKHLRLATIPATGNYVRSYISGKDKMVIQFFSFASKLNIYLKSR